MIPPDYRAQGCTTVAAIRGRAPDSGTKRPADGLSRPAQPSIPTPADRATPDAAVDAWVTPAQAQHIGAAPVPVPVAGRGAGREDPER